MLQLSKSCEHLFWESSQSEGEEPRFSTPSKPDDTETEEEIGAVSSSAEASALVSHSPNTNRSEELPR